MRKLLRLILPTIGLFSVLIYGVSAAAGISNAADVVSATFSEPVNMLLVGIGLIGFGSFIKSRSIRN